MLLTKITPQINISVTHTTCTVTKPLRTRDHKGRLTWVHASDHTCVRSKCDGGKHALRALCQDSLFDQLLQNNFRKVHKIIWKGRWRKGYYLRQSGQLNLSLLGKPQVPGGHSISGAQVSIRRLALCDCRATQQLDRVGGAYIEKRYTGPLALSSVCTWGRKKSATTRQNTKGKDSCSHCAICVIFSSLLLCFGCAKKPPKDQSGKNLCAASCLFFIGTLEFMIFIGLRATNIIQLFY